MMCASLPFRLTVEKLGDIETSRRKVVREIDLGVHQ